jgi:hypothetical protein
MSSFQVISGPWTVDEEVVEAEELLDALEAPMDTSRGQPAGTK